MMHLRITCFFGGKSPNLAGLVWEGQNIGRYSINLGGSYRGGFEVSRVLGWYTRGSEVPRTCSVESDVSMASVIRVDCMTRSDDAI